MEAVVNEPPVPKAVPPMASANQLKVPVEETAAKATVPVPQRAPGVEAVITGSGVMETNTSLEMEQPVAVMVSVSVNVLLMLGLALGLATVALLRLVAGVQE